LLAKVIVFETAAELRSWLYVTSSYCILNDRRKNRRRAAIEEAEGIGFDDEATVAFVNRDLIDAALSILTEGDRELLLAKYESGISIVENARLTYTSVTRLQKRQQRALKRVRLRGKKLR
jgi:DNA-directed RNA polymerase specialized sigma24 family protein